MLEKIGFQTLDDLLDSAVPKSIRLPKKLSMDPPMSESEALSSLKQIMSKNKIMKSFIGMGYYEVLVPNVILRNVIAITKYFYNHYFNYIYILKFVIHNVSHILLLLLLHHHC